MRETLWFVTRRQWIVFWALLALWIATAFLAGDAVYWQCDDVRPRGC